MNIKLKPYKITVVCPNCGAKQSVTADQCGYWKGKCFYCVKIFDFLEEFNDWRSRDETKVKDEYSL